MAVKIARLPSDQFRVRGYKTTPTPFFLLKLKKNTGEHARIGVVVGVSVYKTAVKRNFWKRQARVALSPFVEPGSDILMIASPGIQRLTKKQFRDEVAKAFKKSQTK